LSSSFVITENTLSPRLRAFPLAMDSALAAFTAYEAPQVEAYMKQHAPWTDRTGNARSGLRADPFGNASQRGIVIYHTMPYGIWLEVRFNGRYAIINPTLLAEGRRIMGDLRDLMRLMK
jgi:hypothetical protein